MLQYQLAMGGQADAAAVPVDQVTAEAGFQCLDAAAQGRLAEVYGFGGTGEMAVFGEGDKVAELAKIVHAFCASLLVLECIGIIDFDWPIFQHIQ
jgi:hypothetical protein